MEVSVMHSIVCPYNDQVMATTVTYLIIYIYSVFNFINILWKKSSHSKEICMCVNTFNRILFIIVVHQKGKFCNNFIHVACHFANR